MLSREDRILSEILISRGLVARERIEACARRIDQSAAHCSLADALLDDGDLARAQAAEVVEEARSIDEALAPELPAGQELGEFRLIREIGRGGMGIVYEAEQQSLGRRVALKVLPANAALDERLAIRFLRESRAAGRLRHPGIVSVYTSGRAEGVLYFAMELVEGRTLAEAIASGPLSPEEAARIAAEIARALDHAHESGLIHRDIKPENILLSAAGQAKIADFGLVLEASGASFTLARHVLGTPAFIAPEQVRGEDVDARSDVYGLGAVLYAMLAGSPPYAGEIPSLVLARVLTERPRNLLAVRPELPRSLVAICERAMQPDRAARYRSAAALALDLESFLEAKPFDVEPHDAPAKGRRVAWIGATAAAVAVAVALAAPWWFRARPEQRPTTPALSSTEFRLLPHVPGRKVSPALSPDGKQLAYASDVDGDWDIYLLDLAGGTPLNLTPDLPLTEFSPAFSPDGRSLAFVTPERAIYVVDLSSRKRRAVSDRLAAGLSWSADGREILFTDKVYDAPGMSAASSKLFAVDISSGRSRALTGVYGSQPLASRGSGLLAFISHGSGRTDIWALPQAGGEAVRVTDDDAVEWSPTWSARGTELYFGSDRDGSGGLFKIQVDARSGRPIGAARRASATIFPVPFYLAGGRDGDPFALINTRQDGRLYHLTLAGASGETVQRAVALPNRFLAADFPQLSPDDSMLAFTAVTSQEDLAVGGTDGSEARFLTQDAFRDRQPRWSPDGSRIAFHSDRSGHMEIWTIRPDGSDLTQWTHTDGDATHPVWSPDGTRLAFTVAGRGAFWEPIGGGPAGAIPEALPQPPDADGSFEPSSWSPDGALLAGSLDGIIVYSFADRRYQRLTDFGQAPVWLDAQRLLFTTERDLYLLDRRSGESRILTSFVPAILAPSVSASSDGRSLYVSLSTSDEDVWLAGLKD